MLKKLNPFNSLFGRIFLGFWGTVVFIVAIVLVINQQLSEWDRVRPADKSQLKQLHQITEFLESPNYSDIGHIAKKLERKFRHTRIVLKDADTGKLYFPRILPSELQKGPISSLALEPNPLQIRDERVTIVGPNLVKKGDKSYQLMLISKNRHSSHIWLQMWKMPIWLKLILIGLVTLLPCWFIARGISKPISKLRHSSQALAGGDLQHRVDGLKTRSDEIGHLANDFNNMAEKLSAMVSLYKRLLADVSHELRTPLTRLELSLAMALKNPENNQRQLERAERELHKLDDIIGNVLRLAKLENHEVSIENEEVDLTELLIQITKSSELEARAKNISMQRDISHDLTICGDHILLSFAFDNVIRNAIKYSPDNSQVSIVASKDNGSIQVCISDSGPGVTAQELKQLFVPFFRGKQATQESTGAGLGLAIASKAIMRHGGTIYAENTQPSGLKVTVELPVGGL